MPNRTHNQSPVKLISPSRLKLGACFIYDTLVAIAIFFACVFIFVAVAGDSTHGSKHYLLELFLWWSLGGYFVWCWRHGGQTLAMKTWRLQCVRQNGDPISWPMAMARYVLATASLALLGIGFLWALVDRNRLFLHDKLLNTRIIQLP